MNTTVHLVLDGKKIISENPAHFAAGIWFSVQPLNASGHVYHIVSVVGPTCERLHVARWEIAEGQGHISLMTLAGVGDAGALTTAQKGTVRAWLLDHDPFAYAMASDQVRAALGDPEEFVTLAEATRITGVPLSTLHEAATKGRLPAKLSPCGWLVRTSAVQQRIGLPGRGGRRVHGKKLNR